MTTTEMRKHVDTMESYLSQLEEIDQAIEQCKKDGFKYISLPDIPVPCDIALDLLDKLHQHVENRLMNDVPYEVRVLLDE